MTKLLIFKEKHSTRYFDVSTPEKRAHAFLSVLRERNEDEYREPVKETVQVDAVDQSMLDLTDEQITVLPDELKSYTEKRRTRILRGISRAEKDYVDEKKWWDAVQKMLALPEDEAIKKFYVNSYKRQFNYVEYLVEYRADYQYEGYEFEETEN